jgi:plasmid maintenance system antidote protein VapI
MERTSIQGSAEFWVQLQAEYDLKLERQSLEHTKIA